MVLAPLAGVVPAVATAPALVLVGLLMMRGIGSLSWNDPADSLPVFLAMIVMPFTYSITNGIGAACISYVVLAVARARWRDVHPLMAVVAAAFVVYFAV
jgi:adenine/guanine/hypoxanthine permease